MASETENLFDKAMRAASAYRDGIAADPQLPTRDYHSIRDGLIAPVPDQPTAAGVVLDELVELVDGGLMPMAGSRFFGFVIGSSDPVGVAADWLVTAWGQNAGYQSPTPAVAAIEELAERWLIEILDLPLGSSVGFCTGATVANATCLAAARTGVLLKSGWDPDADGLFGAPPVHVLVGADAHSSVFSALQMIGFGYNRLVKVATDGQGRMRPDALREAMAELTGPIIVIAQAGQINSGCYDPFAEIVEIARTRGAWVHVDGAFGLWARATPSLKQLTAGIEGCDSWCTDGHKWLQVPYDSGFAIVRDRATHQRAMTQWSSYLPTISQGDRVPSAYVPELSRRARGVPVWALLKSLGRSGVAEIVERNCRQARRFAERLAAEPGIHIRNEVVINQVAVNFGDGDPAARKTATEAVIARVLQDGVCFVGGANWRGDWIMRLSVSASTTTDDDIELSADSIIAAWRAVQAESPNASASSR